MRTSWQETRPRERVKLVEAKLVHGADNSAVSEVTLEWRAVEYRGKASAVGRGAIELRVCAQAALDALHQLLSGRMSFRLIGVKSVKAFDDAVAIVALGVHDTEINETRRLIGTAMAPAGSLPTGVARAVLNATNRLLGNFLTTGE